MTVIFQGTEFQFRQVTYTELFHTAPITNNNELKFLKRIDIILAVPTTVSYFLTLKQFSFLIIQAILIVFLGGKDFLFYNLEPKKNFTGKSPL